MSSPGSAHREHTRHVLQYLVDTGNVTQKCEEEKKTQEAKKLTFFKEEKTGT